MRIFATPTRTCSTKRAPAPRRRWPVGSRTRSSMVQRAEIRHILHGSRLQAKLTVGAPGDAYEREADRVAAAVMRMPAPDEPIQRLCSECEEERVARKSPSGEAPRVVDGVEAKIQALRGGGRPLPDATRSFFEPRFGDSFAGVRIHDDSRAQTLARAVDARAFTLGPDIVFGAGQYAPDSAGGRQLLAHELTHVIQQRGVASGPQRKSLPKLDTGGEILQASANECTYGEIRSWAITSMSDHSAPAGLADAKASIGAACARNPCNCVDGSNATAPGDQAAWSNIVAASGGTDHSGGGNFMCVGHQNCWFVHRCYHCENGHRALTDRDSNLATSGSTAVTGHGTLYFYNDALQGWCNSTDRRSGCRT
jgi:hypothetical protein